jgi:FkbM family methyltransferase
MKQVDLPNGLPVQALNQAEADVLYHEIFAAQTYQKYGIDITEGACVFDVGANIGLYSLYLTQQYRNLTLFAFEPIPVLFTVLQQNARTYFPDAHLINAGLSDHSGTARFSFKPSLSMTASMYSNEVNDSVQKEAGAYVWMQAILNDMARVNQIPSGLARWLTGLLTRRFVRVPVLGLLVIPWLGLSLVHRLTTRQIICSLKTLSQIIRENALTHIDVVKIDVEGSELDVVRGIDEGDWAKISQFVIEVHDIDNRVKILVDLLTQHGYQTTVDQQDWALLKLMNVYTIYAIRPRQTA